MRGVIPARPLVATAVGLTFVGLLAGCSQEAPAAPAPAAAATSTATSTSGGTHHEHDGAHTAEAPAETPTPTPTATRDLPRPDLSDVGKTFTEDGASTFANYYVRVLNYSRNTGDVELLKSISDAGCSGCDYDVSHVQGMLQHGYSHMGLETQFVGTTNLAWHPETHEIQMDVIVNRPPHEIVDASGAEIEQVPGLTEAQFFLWLRWSGDRWIVWEAR